MNKVILLGRLGQDPESKAFPSGDVYTKFSVGTNENYKDRDGNKKSKVNWTNVVCFKRTAEIASKWLRKGRQVLVEGKLQYRSYEAKDGTERTIAEVVASNLTMLGDKVEGKQQDNIGNQKLTADGYNPGFACLGDSGSPQPDEIPF